MSSLSKIYQSTFYNGVKDNRIPLFVLLALTVITYFYIPSHSFLVNWDDHSYITKNPAVRGFSLENLRLAFTQYYVGNYAPIQIISYMWDYTLWGLNPFGFILTNLICHFLSGILLYFILLRHGVWKWGAAFGTAVFLLHPVQMESVAWVSQRKNLLAMLFYLAAFIAWLKYRKWSGKGQVKWYVASIMLITLSLLSKSVAVIFPLMLIIYDLTILPLQLKLRGHVDKIPYIMAAAAVGLVAVMTQTPENGGGRVHYPDNLIEIPLTMLPVLARYIKNILLPYPSNLSVMYFPDLKGNVDSTVLLSIVLAVFLLMLGIYLYRRVRPLFFWYALFFLGLAPVSQIIPLVTLMNDRYLYFPMLGVAGVVAYLANTIHGRYWHNIIYRWATLVFSLAILALLAYVSIERGKVWESTITLFGDAVIKYPTQADPWSRLAEGYIHTGDLLTAQNYYEKASAFGKLDNEAMFNLAQLYIDRREFGKAYTFINYLNSAEINFKEAGFFLGEYYYKTGALPEAEVQLLQYISKYPDYAPALTALGHVYALMNNHPKTREYYFRAVKAGGNNIELFYSIACLESAEGNIDVSLQYLQRALEMGFNKRELLFEGKYLENARRSPKFMEVVDRLIIKSAGQ